MALIIIGKFVVGKFFESLIAVVNLPDPLTAGNITY